MKSNVITLVLFGLIFTSKTYSDWHPLEESGRPKFSDLISERCLSHFDKTIEGKTRSNFFEIIWSDPSYAIEMNKVKSWKTTPCLTEADKIHLSIYRQRDANFIILSYELGLSFEKLIRENQIPEDLFQLFVNVQDRIKWTGHPSLMRYWYSEFKEKIEESKRIKNAPFISDEELRDLYQLAPNRSVILDGKYDQTVRLFLFCRRNRNHPCLFTAKDKNDRPVMTDDGKIWHQPALAASARGYPSNIVNGQTPQGVHTMDSVMPFADQYRSFGSYRRVILNWVPLEEGDERDQNTTGLLSPLSEDSLWWKQASISRNVGRTDLRIHGTGKLNTDPDSTHYPLRKTNGCISQREGKYGDVEYIDQRHILNRLMEGLGLEATFENEEKISGTLYVIELDAKEAPVTWRDVEKKLGLLQETNLTEVSPETNAL